MDLKKVFSDNKKWKWKKLESDNEYFEKLSQGQNPEVLYIGCADSRVTAEEMMGAEPGEVFVHRNIANVVPNGDLNALSVINYAVIHLKVKHIVVCGHYGCGGVMAAMQSVDLGLLNPWLRHIRDVYRLHQDELDAIEDEQLRYDRLVELNVQEQCVNVLKTPEVQLAYRSGNLDVHGWIANLRNGEILDLQLDINEILGGIRKIYHLD